MSLLKIYDIGGEACANLSAISERLAAQGNRFAQLLAPNAQHAIMTTNHKPGWFFTPNEVGDASQTNFDWNETRYTPATKLVTVWIECDPPKLSLPETGQALPGRRENFNTSVRNQLEKLDNFITAGLPKPTAVVLSGDPRYITHAWGKSVHIFWRLSYETSPLMWAELENGLIGLFDSDPISSLSGAVARFGGLPPHDPEYDPLSTAQTVLGFGKTVDASELLAFVGMHTSTGADKVKAWQEGRLKSGASVEAGVVQFPLQPALTPLELGQLFRYGTLPTTTDTTTEAFTFVDDHIV